MALAWRLGCVLLLLSGCSSLAPPAALPPDPDLPPLWSRASAAHGVEANTQWWARFNDPLMLQLIAAAEQANPSVLGAQAALRQARALARSAAAGLQPQLGSSASAQRNDSSQGEPGNLFRIGLDASWEIDVFGGQRSGVAVQDANALARRASLADVRLSVVAEVGLRYIALRGTQARIAVAEANLRNQRQTLQLTDWREQAGLLSTLELAQARAAAAQTEAQLPALRESALQAMHALAVLTGRPPAALTLQLQNPAALPEPDADLALRLPAETLRQRPDVRAAEQQVRAAQGRVAQADADRYPRFQLGGSLGLQALSLSGLGSAALLSSVLINSSWALWDGGAAQAQLDAQQAALAQALSTYRGSLLTALQEVEDALLALQADRERSRLLALAADAAQRAAELARQRYASGIVDFQTVLETQRSQLASDDNLSVALAEVSADHIRLFKALGGGWQPDEERP
jgi:NodT family efflux transporter outer membrane factor (OMF) lipoprotein